MYAGDGRDMVIKDQDAELANAARKYKNRMAAKAKKAAISLLKEFKLRKTQVLSARIWRKKLGKQLQQEFNVLERAVKQAHRGGRWVPPQPDATTFDVIDTRRWKKSNLDWLFCSNGTSPTSTWPPAGSVRPAVPTQDFEDSERYQFPDPDLDIGYL